MFEYLKECDAANDSDDMPCWEEYRIKYFYQNLKRIRVIGMWQLLDFKTTVAG